MKLKDVGALSLSLLLIVGAISLWRHAEPRQDTLNRQLIAALVHGDNQEALALVRAGADPNTRYLPPPPSVRQAGYIAASGTSSSTNYHPTAFMIACGAPWDQDNAISEALQYNPGASTLVQAMLAHGANVNVQDESGLTPLFYAITDTDSRYDTLRLLLEHGADVNWKNWQGWTPLIYAVWGRAHPNTIGL